MKEAFHQHTEDHPVEPLQSAEQRALSRVLRELARVAVSVGFRMGRDSSEAELARCADQLSGIVLCAMAQTEAVTRLEEGRSGMRL
jgi:hypothetical protein